MDPLSSQTPISPLLEGLNPDQQEAVLATEGPVLLIAGAGSGKTRTLTHRIAYLIAEKGVAPYNILAVTFTNKAAGEMKKRVLNLMYGQEKAEAILESTKGHGAGFYRTDLPVMGTFHSVCVQILRKYLHLLGIENQFAIYDETDCEILIKTIMKELGIPPEKTAPKAVLSHISGAKNVLLTPEQYRHQSHSYFSEKVAELYPIYQKRLAQNHALDFDDILMKTVELFQKQPAVLAELQERFRYICVDEYQDTNHAQYILIRELAAKYRNLCVVGDDWQSIYSWRGATMQNLLDFKKDYADVKTIKLEQNYRSTSVILDASHAIIKKNRQRTDKTLWTKRTAGEKIKIFEARDEKHEGELLVREMERVLRSHESPSYRDFAFLYRTNAQSRILEETLMRHGIPYHVVGGVKFYARKEIKDVLSYLRLIQNPADNVSLLRIINTPPRKIGSTTLEKLNELSHSRNDMPLFSVMKEIEALLGDESVLSDVKISTLKSFIGLFGKLQKINRQYSASGVIKHLIEESKYKEFLLDGTPEGEARFENVQELVSVASKYDALEPGISLATFLEEVALITDLDQMDDRANSVTLMTLHSAKGLEFPYVFLCGLEEGIFPHSRSLFEPQQLEEERRLMYVGLTRAMERVYLSYAENRLLYGTVKSNAPSQFLEDIPEELIEREGSTLKKVLKQGDGILSLYRSGGLKRVPRENEFGFYPDAEPGPGDEPLSQDDEGFGLEESSLDAGDRVQHKMFGEGLVVGLKGGIATIAFKNRAIGVKKLALSVAPLKKL